MKIDPGKYIVFNRERFAKMMSALRLEVDGSIVDHIVSGELLDAVVIRKQDAFAAPAFYSYAAAITSALSVLHDDTMVVTGSPGVVDQLESLADYFAQLGDECRTIANTNQGKVPTP